MSAYRLGIFTRATVRKTFQKQLKRSELNNLRRFASTNNNAPKQMSTLKLGLVGVAGGLTVGTVYALYNSMTSKTDHMMLEKNHVKIIDKLPNVKIAKRVINPNDKSNLELVLFQFQTCPFCCKVRAYLDFMGLSYSIVEVDAVLRQDLKWSDYKKVPMLLARRQDGKYVQLTDSSTIISVIASYLTDYNQDIGELARLYPTVSFFDDNGSKKYDVMNKYFLMYQDNSPKNVQKEDMLEERKWRSWADSHLVHLISPNVYQTRKEAFETFEWFAKAGEWDIHFPKWERDMMVFVGATAMWAISKRLKKRHGFTDDVRSHMYVALNKWTSELEKKKSKFMGGKKPNLADLSVFGVLSSMEGCQAFKDCLDNTKIGEWFYAVKEIVMKNKGRPIREHHMQDSVQSNFA